MIYLDTNILVYNSVLIDKLKFEKSQKNILELLKNDTIFLSSLCLQEFIFTCSKLKLSNELINKFSNYYFQFVKNDITKEIIKDSIILCQKTQLYFQINDIIHLKTAEKYCTKIITYDTIFKHLNNYSALDIEILSD